MPVFVADVSIGDFSTPEETYRAIHGWCARAFPTARLPGVELEPERPDGWNGPRLGLHATFLYLWRGNVDAGVQRVVDRSGMLDFDFEGKVRRFKVVGDENYGLLLLEFKCPEMNLRAAEVWEMVERETARSPKMTRINEPGYINGFNPHITIAQFDSVNEAHAAIQSTSISADLRGEWGRHFSGRPMRMHRFRAIE